MFHLQIPLRLNVARHQAHEDWESSHFIMQNRFWTVDML